MKAIGQAFDDVWAQIAPQVSGRAGAIEAARYRLAHLVLIVAKKGILERGKIKDEVLQLVHASPTKLRSTRRLPFLREPLAPIQLHWPPVLLCIGIGLRSASAAR